MGVNKPFVITIVGAESSGKTTLAKQLAEYFNCAWVPEYARDYLEKLNRPYELKDLEEIAIGQIRFIEDGMTKKVDYPGENRESSSVNREPIKSGESLLKNHEIIKKILIKMEEPHQHIMIVDGGMLNIHLWARIRFNETIPLVLDALEHGVTDLYLLCRPWKEWTPDPLREAPRTLERGWIFNQYLKELVERKVPFEIISTR